MFLFKKKPIVVDCFTNDSNTFVHSKRDKAVKFLPDWWKNIPKELIVDGNFFPYPTMKKCDGFINLYKQGIILPMWSDLALEVGPQGSNDIRWQFADCQTQLDFHAPEQSNYIFKPDDTLHVKILSPWKIKTSEDILWHCNDVFWHRANMLTRTCPGMVSFRYQYATHVNLVVKRISTKRTETISFLDPLVHFVPVTERPIDLRHHLLDDVEFKKLVDVKKAVTFTCNYQKLKKVERNNQND
jgi:hypothetical protein